MSTAAGQVYRVDTNNQNVTWATPLGGDVAVTKSGTGALTLSGNNTTTGVITINAGGAVILSGNNSGRAAAAGRTVVNGTLQLVAGAGNTASGTSTALSAEPAAGVAALTLNANSTLNLRSDANVTFAGTNNFGGGSATIDVNNVAGINGSGPQNGVITLAAGGLTTGGNTFTITGSNGYSLSLPSVIASGNPTFNPTTASMSIGALSGNTTTNARTFTLGGTSTGNIVTGAIINGTGAAGTAVTTVTKTNSSTWTLAGANTFSGNVTVQDGLLSVTGSIVPTNPVPGTAPTLTMGANTAGGGTFSYGASTAGTIGFSATTITSGTNAIIASGSNTLNLGAVSRTVAVSGNGGPTWSVINFGGTGTITTTTTTNANGIFAAGGAAGDNGGYATFNDNTWAVAPAVSGGAITGLATGSYVNTGTTALAAALSTDNIDIATNGTNIAGSLGFSQFVNSLRFNSSTGPATVDATNGLTLNSGGILVTSNVGNNPVTISGGMLKGALRSGGALGRDLVLIQNNVSNTLTIGSAIVDTLGGESQPALRKQVLEL